MSKARLIITAVVVEGRLPSEVARTYGVARSWVYTLVARYRAEGDTAFEPRSRRPHTSPTAIDPAIVARIGELRDELFAAGLDAGPQTICWHLEHHHQIRVAPATVHRHLVAGGKIAPEPKKRPRSSYLRFEADQPNECWQADVTHYRLITGVDAKILCWLDDHARYAISVTAHLHVTGRTVVDAFTATVEVHGIPASTLTDNAMVFTTRLSGGRGGRNGFETLLDTLGVIQKNSRPNHPTTCGKVERFHQTLKRWLRAQPDQPRTIAQLQAALDVFVTHYNHHRPHRSLARTTPAVAYTARPKATPTGTHTDHYRVRRDRVDIGGKATLRIAGRMFKIGIGRTHTRTPILLLVHDLDIRVIHAHTGEIIRQLTLDTTRTYQPTGRPSGGPKGTRKPPTPDP